MPRAERRLGASLLLFECLKFYVTAHLACNPGDLVQYHAVFATNWTKDIFPKQYPEWRPPAQWSRVVGVSHNEDYRLFQLGFMASPELKLFAETGKQEILGQTNRSSEILDEFLMSNIKTGVGETSSDFIVDSSHTMVSLVARIVPSPDWFVGVDSINLCADGYWLDAITIEASPLDAGTDNGFTFTAPNWSTEPQEPIYKITSQYPRHPANSFYYPSLQDLPPIATFIITKKRIYREVQPHPVSSTQTPLDNHTEGLSADLRTSQVLEPNLILKKIMKKKARKKKRSKNDKSKWNCKVGIWSEWSACNAPCGQSLRHRNITRPGRTCPPLVQERTCGCTKYIFDW